MKFKRSIQIFSATLAILGAVAGFSSSAQAQAPAGAPAPGTAGAGSTEAGDITNNAPNGGGPSVVPPSTTVNSTPGIPPTNPAASLPAIPQAVDDPGSSSTPTAAAPAAASKATNLPNTGGEPLVVVLSGLSLSSAAFLLRRKLV